MLFFSRKNYFVRKRKLIFFLLNQMNFLTYNSIYFRLYFYFVINTSNMFIFQLFYFILLYLIIWNIFNCLIFQQSWKIKCENEVTRNQLAFSPLKGYSTQEKKNIIIFYFLRKITLTWSNYLMGTLYRIHGLEISKGQIIFPSFI